MTIAKINSSMKQKNQVIAKKDRSHKEIRHISTRKEIRHISTHKRNVNTPLRKQLIVKTSQNSFEKLLSRVFSQNSCVQTSRLDVRIRKGKLIGILCEIYFSKVILY